MVIGEVVASVTV